LTRAARRRHLERRAKRCAKAVKMTATDNAKAADAPAPRDLDPADWSEFRQLAHAMLDDVITHIETVRERPVWQAAPAASRQRFQRLAPRAPRSLPDVLEDVRSHVFPYATGNLHPAFMGWVHGAGTPIGMIAEMIAGGLDMNCGGRDHIGLEIERQVAKWMAEVLHYPATASGLFLTGSSMANFLAVIIAKTGALGAESRRQGLGAAGLRLAAYASAEAHGCIAQAMELSGIGSAHLRGIAVDEAGQMDVARLEAAIAQDRAAGLRPFLVIGTAGSVNTGAIDPLEAIAGVAAREKLWFHVDGAIGALAAFSAELRPLLSGIERSDSVALDFHKWGHVPYDAGFLLVRDGAAHRQAFANPTAYLQRAARGLARGETWPCDLGPDLSRGCRALKTWMTIAALGTDRIGDAILANCELARFLGATIAESPLFVLKAPIALNIVCFGLRGAGDGSINRELVLDLQEAGLAAPSWTTVGGEDVIRCAIVNHRTTRADIDRLLASLEGLARTRLGQGGAP
jgi:aromatic-L-amino-acid/L-tryptophan decarboxylase